MANNIFKSAVADGLFQRLEQLTADAQPKWGIMTPAQMLKHLQLENDLAIGRYKGKDYSNFAKEWAFKMVFRGRMGLPMIFRKFRMVPAIPELDVVKSDISVGDFDIEKARFKSNLNELLDLKQLHDLHPAIGKMTREEWGLFYAWHTDYHFTQFGI